MRTITTTFYLYNCFSHHNIIKRIDRVLPKPGSLHDVDDLDMNI